MPTNDEMIEKLNTAFKGIIETSTLGTSVLQPEKFDAFVRTMQARTVILKEARFIPMGSQVVDIDRVGFLGRILTSGGALASQNKGAAQGNTTLTTNDYVAPSFATNKLVAREMQAVCGIYDTTLRRNIERGDFEQTLVELFGEAAGRDLEEWALLANMALNPSSYPFLSLTDGWVKNAGNKVYGMYGDKSGGLSTTIKTDNAVTAGSSDLVTTATDLSAVAAGQVFRVGVPGSAKLEFVTVASVNDTTDTITFTTPLKYDHDAGEAVVQINAIPGFYSGNLTSTSWVEDMFNAMIAALPKQYLQNPADWRFYVTWEVYDGYRDVLRARQTNLGDTATTGNTPLYYKGIPVVYTPMLERSAAYNAGAGTWGKVALLSNPDNMVWGVFQQVTIEPSRVAVARRTDFVLTVEADCNYEDENAAVAAFIEVPAPAA